MKKLFFVFITLGLSVASLSAYKEKCRLKARSAPFKATYTYIRWKFYGVGQLKQYMQQRCYVKLTQEEKAQVLNDLSKFPDQQLVLDTIDQTTGLTSTVLNNLAQTHDQAPKRSMTVGEVLKIINDGK